LWVSLTLSLGLPMHTLPHTVFQYADHIAILWPPLLIPPFSIPLLVFVIWF